MKITSLSVASNVLKIDRRTLNKLLDELGIVPVVVTYDARIRGISMADLKQVRPYIAERLGREVIDEGKEMRHRDLEEVKERLKTLEQMQMRVYSFPEQRIFKLGHLSLLLLIIILLQNSEEKITSRYGVSQ